MLIAGIVGLLVAVLALGLLAHVQHTLIVEIHGRLVLLERLRDAEPRARQHARMLINRRRNP